MKPIQKDISIYNYTEIMDLILDKTEESEHYNVRELFGYCLPKYRLSNDSINQIYVGTESEFNFRKIDISDDFYNETKNLIGFISGNLCKYADEHGYITVEVCW